MNKTRHLLTFFYLILVPLFALGQKSSFEKPRFVLAIHGGAGTILKEKMTDSLELAYRETLEHALRIGYDAIRQGKSSLDAVELTIQVLEDSPLFNAGKGAVFTHEGHNELDASIMEGFTRNAGAVAGVRTIKHPISAARAVMEKSAHVMLSGKGAEAFASGTGLEVVDPSYFRTEQRWNDLQNKLEINDERAGMDQVPNHQLPAIAEKFGTVGCVALDNEGHLAAGTSTGGMLNKRFGRVGDSPIIGAGTYADDRTAAISCTGWGEYFIRQAAAVQVCAKIQYGGLSLFRAAQEVIDEIGEMGGNGGLIAINQQGEVAMPFNTAGMYRGTVRDDGTIEVSIYGAED
ncbi:MAG: isoaspartyl peptidase/L-asparaginase family protein [Sphingobacterium sp.]